MDNPAETITPFTYVFPSCISADAAGAASLQWADAAGAFGRSLPLRFGPGVASVQGIADAFTREEIAQIVAMGESQPRNDGRVELGPETYRVSHIAWLTPEPSNHWLFHRLAVLFAQANRHYGFDLTGFVEPLQYTRYDSNQHFDWHLDLGGDQTSARKLSMSLQLSGPDEYEGGRLEFSSLLPGEEARRVGTAVFFPSYLAHRVHPVQSGVRRSLVAWAYGPAFR